MTVLIWLLLLVSAASAWVIRPQIQLSPSALKMSDAEVEVVTLEALDDHEAEGTKMAKSITAWLDAEWMPQQVHVEMAESAKASYIKCREDGVVEIMCIMMAIADDLNEVWFEKYDADAFVNAWDISNYVSDYLTHISGSETCECSNKIY